MSQVQVRAGRIRAEFDPKRTPELELGPQLDLIDNLRGALAERTESLVWGHGAGANGSFACYLFLFSSSRTSSIVNGRSCALKDFWLLPRTRNGRVSAYS